MVIFEVESDWRETGIPCPVCGWMTYSDGKSRPQCGNEEEGCLDLLADEYIWTWLITDHELPETTDELIRYVNGVVGDLDEKIGWWLEQHEQETNK